MPALVKRRVGSPWGTSEELRTRRWPLLSKKRRNISRISLPLIFLVSEGVMASRMSSLCVGRVCGVGKTDDYGGGGGVRQLSRGWIPPTRGVSASYEVNS